MMAKMRSIVLLAIELEMDQLNDRVLCDVAMEVSFSGTTEMVISC